MTRLGIPWSGDLGVQSTFTWMGIQFVMTGPGVPEGTKDPYHVSTSSWGSPASFIVGVSGNTAERSGLITASARSRPEFTAEAAVCVAEIIA